MLIAFVMWTSSRRICIFKRAVGFLVYFCCCRKGAPNSHFDGATMSNYPLRGGKGTLWDGGQHGAAFVHGPRLGVPTGALHSTLMHASDWIPTLAQAAGLNLTAEYLESIDGVSLWSSIKESCNRGGGVGTSWKSMDGWPGLPPQYGPRTEILHNIDPVSKAAAIRVKVRKCYSSGAWTCLVVDVNPMHWLACNVLPQNYKLLVNVGNGTGWGPKLPPNNLTATISTSSWRFETSKSIAKLQLFNIAADPEERLDLASDPVYADIIADLSSRLDAYSRSAVPCRNPDPDTVRV